MTEPSTADVSTLLHEWNDAVTLAHIKIEDDTLRDGLQGAYVTAPSLAQKQELLAASVRAGCQAAMIGFPASSATEYQESLALVQFLETSGLACVPRFLARARREDLEPIARINDACDRDVWADFFIGSSRLRRTVEGWSYEALLAKVAEASDACRELKLPFGISIEDATRSTPEDIEAVIRIAVDGGAGVVTVCDTVGASQPSGAARLVRFVRETIASLGGHAEVWWHGHNDRGLALANSLAAAGAGADTISGSFLGLGERTGNTALEQVILFLVEAGSTAFDLEGVAAYCQALSRYCEIAIPDNWPLVGRQAFATCTGTHAAAIIKARRISTAHEDLIFSSVAASVLGRRQDIMVGPTSGLSNARSFLDDLGIAASAPNAQRLLAHAKDQKTWLRRDDVLALFSRGE